MTVSGQIDTHRTKLTPAERRVAAVVADAPEAVAFGTVAGVARRSGASGATVMRLAAKLGYEGFVELQAAVREEMAGRLRPASQRIRQPLAGGDPLTRALAVELANVAATIDAVDRSGLERAVRLLADRKGRVLVLAGDASEGVALLFTGELAMLRPGTELVQGSEVRVARMLAEVGPDDTLVVMDLSRYDRWLVEATERAAARGARVIALTDSALSPLAATASVTFTVSDEGVGPFDSHVGMMALANALLAAVVTRLRSSATQRLDGIEAAWTETGALVTD